MARLVTSTAVVMSLVAFVGQERGSSSSWTQPLSRATYVLLVLALVAALLSERRPSVIVVRVQALLAVVAIAFVVVAIVKYYGNASILVSKPFVWANEAKRLGLAAIPFALTLARRRSELAMNLLYAAVGAAVVCAVYAAMLGIDDLASYLWWSMSVVAAFFAASVAAGLERGSSVTLPAPVTSGAGGDTGRDPGVE